MGFFQQVYKGKNDVGQYIGTLLLVFAGWQIIGVLPIAFAAAAVCKDRKSFLAAAQANFLNLPIDKNLFLFLMILSFVFGLIALFIGVKLIHKRNIISIITSRPKIDWKRFFTSFLLWGVFLVLTTIGSIYLEPEYYVWNFKPIPFFTLVLISFLFIPFQTTFEELLFRGYLMQAFGAWFKNRWLPLILTSVIFGLMHLANPEVEKIGYISMVYYIGTGFFFGIVTLLDEGTELSMGLHAVNNIMAAFLVTTEWTVFQTEALYINTSEPSVGIELFLPVLIFYPLVLLFLSKKYKWTNFKGRLFGKIEKPEEKIELEGIK